MGQATITATVDLDLAQQLEKQDNKSKTIRKALREYFDQEKDTRSPLKILEISKTALSPMQSRLIDKLLEQDQMKFSSQEIRRVGVKEVGYSKKQYIKNAVKAFDRLDEVPLNQTSHGLEVEQVECECGHSDNAVDLYHQGQCFSCKREVVLR